MDYTRQAKEVLKIAEKSGIKKVIGRLIVLES